MRHYNALFVFLLTAALIAGSLRAQDLKGAPDPVQLFRLAQDEPGNAYEGHLMITQWSGTEAKAEEANIYYKPPRAYRLEFLLPDGRTDRVVMSDGVREKVQFMQNGVVVKEYTNKQLPRLLNDEQEKELLFLNYKVSLVGSETILGRSTWILELSPASSGKPFQQVRVDSKTHVILETKRYTPQGSNLSMTRFTRFEPKSTMSDSLFLSAESPEGLLNDQKDTSGLTTGSLLVPIDGYQQTLLGGFSLLNADNFELKGNSVRYLKYTDGLLPLSMFETPLPIKIPTGELNKSDPQALALAPSGAAQSHIWNNGLQYYTLIGDVDSKLLAEIASTIK